jgi:acyl transferase domain-containing protein
MMVAINKEYGTELSNSKLFDHPTISRFSVFLQKELEANRAASGPEFTAQNTSAPVQVTEDFPVTKRDSRRDRKRNSRRDRRIESSSLSPDEKIAIIGMSGRYPKANDLGQYWDNLVAGRNCIVEVPRERFDVHRYYDPERAKEGKTNSKWLGAVDDFDCFDPLFFRISPQEAEHMDPQHRIFLQEAYRTFEDAGYSSNSLSSSRCGVYLGISTNEYSSLITQSGIMSAPVTSNSYAIGAARIAYYLNLKGPAISVDTACSSSLVAIHLASQALLNREIDMALAGGVSLWLTPESYVIMGQAGMFSSQGQCKAFDDGADGIVNGEGVGAVLLKRLSDAQRDNDLIYGVIVGSGINQDGKTNGITAPSASSQADLERSVYAKHKIDPETISYIEAHGTGTKLGDPIELEALATVFQEKTSKKNFCALASVKSNIGHTTSAAGVAAVHKVLLSLGHRTLVPTLNVRKENSNFDFANSPFYISRETKAWEAAAGSLRRAGVNSFGFSGTNAHLVIEEYVPPARQIVAIRANPTSIVPLSARTKEQLQQKARGLLKFIRAQQPSNVPFQDPSVSSQTMDLSALAYTLQIGREAMEERLGFVVSSVNELSEKLTRYLIGEKNIDGVYQGRPNPDHDHVTAMVQDDDMLQAIERWITGQKFSTLLDWWTRGLNFDWNKLYPDVKPQRVSLPTYPFARERYWISSSCASRPADAGLEEEIDLKSIEDIITKLEDDVISPDQAVRELKILV